MNIKLFILLAILVQHCCATNLLNNNKIVNQVQQHDEEEMQLNNNNNNNQQKSYDIKSDEAADDNLLKEEIQKQQVQDRRERERRGLTDWLIAPNTNWCGRGNTANGTYNNLGGSSAADKCCRKHDFCQHSIPAFSSRYELFNYRPYTLSQCQCDQRFRTCLKLANDADANTIGNIFFNMVQIQCFKLRTKKTCQERNEGGKCLRYELSYRAELRQNKKY